MMKSIISLSKLYVETGVTSSGSCRLCLRTVVSSSTPIFTEGETFQRLRARILDCCPVTLFEDDQLPKMICDDCKRKVAATYEFRERCRESEHKLRSFYDSSFSYAARHAARHARTPYQKTVRDRSVQTDDRTYDQPTGVAIDSEKDNSRINEDKGEEVSRQNVRTKCWSEIRRVKGKEKNQESRLMESERARMNGTGDADELEVGIVEDKSQGNEEKKKRRIKRFFRRSSTRIRYSSPRLE